VRVAALGKTGSISGLLKTLGAMSPDERKSRARRSTPARPVAEAIADKKAAWRPPNSTRAWPARPWT
jgi:phenylalanyl-tRNA synthetase alpha chain